MFIFGGLDRKNAQCFNDLWKLKLDSLEWTHILSSGYKLSGRFYHSSAIVDNNVYTYGGTSTYTFFVKI
jgi:hypothetical protein